MQTPFPHGVHNDCAQAGNLPCGVCRPLMQDWARTESRRIASERKNENSAAQFSQPTVYVSNKGGGQVLAAIVLVLCFAVIGAYVAVPAIASEIVNGFTKAFTDFVHYLNTLV